MINISSSFRILCVGSLLLTSGYTSARKQTQKAMQQVDFSQVQIHDDFWTPRLQNNAKTTIPVCIDQIENQTGRMQNFYKAAIPEGPHSGIFFDDSDVYKAVEGMAYSLINNPDPELEKKADQWIAAFAAAQQKDGYINTFFTIQEPQNRWNDMDKHEMYCAGHMLEAGVAYYKATGKRSLLDVARRMVDYMMTIFGPGKRHWVPGHEEIELALVKLYQLTHQQKYLDFAYWLLEERGHDIGRMNVREDVGWNKKQYQDAYPVRDLESIHGHAVRAMYLFCGMADVASYKDGTGYMEALDRVWEDVTKTRMYVTGGIGVAYMTEGFSEPYDLPNLQAYCETCASIGMVLWNHRMNEWRGDSKYADILERCLYNGVISGINTTGDRFFYVNPLASNGDHHRQAWYGCACCPSNVCRFIPSIGNYIYGTSSDALWVNLYIGSQTTCRVGKQKVSVDMQTAYPWQGTSTLTFSSKWKGSLKLRIPGWAQDYKVQVNGQPVAYDKASGYAVVTRKWKPGDVVSVDIPMSVQCVSADPRVKEDVGKYAIQRGPLVYCAEQMDNTASWERMQVSKNLDWKQQRTDEMGGILRLSTQCQGTPLNLIPYYSWDNRQPCEMKVWIPSM